MVTPNSLALESGADPDERAPHIDAGASHERNRHPEAEPPGGLVVVLSRWETQGGHWRVLNETEAWLTVGLVSCDEQEMSRITSARTAVLTEFLGGRLESSQ